MEKQGENGDSEKIAGQSREISPIEGMQPHELTEGMTDKEIKALAKALVSLHRSSKKASGRAQKFSGVPDSGRADFKSNVDEAFAPKEELEEGFNGHSN